MRSNCLAALGVGALIVSLVVTSGCDSEATADRHSLPADGGLSQSFSGEYPFNLVATSGMVSDIARVVAGEKADVIGLMGEGVDPHLYKPTRNDVKHLLESHIVFYSGLLLEGRMTDTFTKVARGGKPVFAVCEAIDESYLREPPEFAGHYDPHVWMDVTAWSQCVDFIAKTLGEFDPPGAGLYEQNAETYQAQLAELDDYVRRAIASIPIERRVLITAHDAFGYFSRAYDIPVKAVQGISTESEAGVNDINVLVDFIVEKQIQAIFVESSVSDKNLRAVIEGSQDKGWKIEIGGELFSDAMGAPGTYEGTYIGMIDHNATLIARKLGGEAPKGGFQGKLGH